LAQTARLAGELDGAASFYMEGLRLAHRLGAQEEILGILAGLGGLAVARQQLERAACLLGVADALADALGVPLQPEAQTQFDQDVAAVQEALPEEAFSQAWAASHSLPLDVAVNEALALADELA
jgi:hypothetical protein